MRVQELEVKLQNYWLTVEELRKAHHHQERIAHKAEARRIEICSIGPLPEVDHNSEHGLKLDSELISVEEGDRILATGLLPPPPMDI